MSNAKSRREREIKERLSRLGVVNKTCACGEGFKGAPTSSKCMACREKSRLRWAKPYDAKEPQKSVFVVRCLRCDWTATAERYPLDGWVCGTDGKHQVVAEETKCARPK